MTEFKPYYIKRITSKAALNNYIDTINEELGTELFHGANRKAAAQVLINFLNQHDFLNHEGAEINDETIDEFITRIKTENNNDNLNFLPNNKLEQPMTQEEQAVNPLAQLVQDTISVNDLIGIYNRYAPNPITEEQLQASTGGNLNLAKAQLINQIL